MISDICWQPLTERREEIIMVNRVIRDDPSKGDMHNRETLTFRLLFKSLCDYDLWPLYLIGLTNHIPFATPNIYLTLSLKGMGFTTFQTNLLVIPSQLLHSECWSPRPIEVLLTSA